MRTQISEKEMKEILEAANAKDAAAVAQFGVNGISYKPILIEKGRIYAEKVRLTPKTISGG